GRVATTADAGAAGRAAKGACGPGGVQVGVALDGVELHALDRILGDQYSSHPVVGSCALIEGGHLQAGEAQNAHRHHQQGDEDFEEADTALMVERSKSLHQEQASWITLPKKVTQMVRLVEGASSWTMVNSIPPPPTSPPLERNTREPPPPERVTVTLRLGVKVASSPAELPANSIFQPLLQLPAS